MHELWTTHQWQNATTEQVITALFDSPLDICPFDMAAITRYHPAAKTTYLNLFYQGKIPNSVKKINRV